MEFGIDKKELTPTPGSLVVFVIDKTMSEPGGDLSGTNVKQSPEITP